MRAGCVFDVASAIESESLISVPYVFELKQHIQLNLQHSNRQVVRITRRTVFGIYSAGQQVMLELLHPEVERLYEELAKYQALCNLSSRAILQQKFLALGERLNYCIVLILSLTRTLR